MIRPILTAGIIAGLIAGAVGFTVQALKVVPLIHQAETFEARAKAQAGPGGQPADAAVVAANSRRNSLARAGLTLAASLLTGAGFGLLLAGAIAFSGRDPNVMEGIVWGFAGFAVFTLAPDTAAARFSACEKRTCSAYMMGGSKPPHRKWQLRSMPDR